MRIEFCGAAQTVTGSMHLVETGGKRVLLDCGMFQGHRAEAYERNRNFPFDPKSIAAVVLSHAHIDHSGNLPGIVKQGFRGAIYCTPATRDLCSIMLADSAHLQEKDVEYLERRKKEHLELLYSVEDVHEVLTRMRAVPYHQRFEVVEGVECEFHDAGHILGSAITALSLTDGAKHVNIAFTGDLGRKNHPILRNPEGAPDAEIVLSESTYGDRVHEAQAESVAMLRSAVLKAHGRDGKIIIPAFSVGRTQDVLYLLHGLAVQGAIPAVPVYVDSPLSVNATAIYRMHSECFGQEMRRRILRDRDALGFDDAKYITSVEDSKRLNAIDHSCIILSASGMCEGGRVLHHLANNLEDERAMVVLAGYQAYDTLGRRLADGAKRVRIYGEEYHVRAEIAMLHGLSAHGDRNDLFTFIQRCNKPSLRTIYLVHGDIDKQTAYKNFLGEQGYACVEIPRRGQSVEL